MSWAKMGFAFLFVVGISTWYWTREGEWWVIVLGWIPLILWHTWLADRIFKKKEE